MWYNEIKDYCILRKNATWRMTMTIENELINKSYYRGILDETKQGHSVKILGEMYMENMQTLKPDLSTVRFAQGEVYFLNNDYEAAIFKWQQPMEEEFIPWAQKNIADAHLEMGLLGEAEKFYKQVNTSSLTLKSEVLLQLFSVYKEQNHQEGAVRTIREAVKLNPDYPDVTEIAQTYLEEIENFEYAIELARDEALRTESPYWFEILSGYVDKGLTADYQPSYFEGLLLTLRHMDKGRLDNFLKVLWGSYEESDMYLEWLDMVNNLLMNDDILVSYEWKKLPGLYEQGYFDLISDRYFIQDIKGIIQGHFTNWLQVSNETNGLVASTAVLAWNEMYPSTLDGALIHEAETLFGNSRANENGREDGLELLASIQAWASKEGMLDDLSAVTEPMLEGYNMMIAKPSKIRNVAKASIEFLLEQKVELERAEQDAIDSNSGLLTSLHDTHSQVKEMEKEMTPIITTSFLDLKESLIQKMKEDLPKLLRDCAKMIDEDSDLSTLNVELNKEMNKQMTIYMDDYVNNYLKQTAQDWTSDCKSEFETSQMAMYEYSAHLSQQMDDVEIALHGDFKVLDDWQRDLERMARSLLRVEEIDFVLRSTPSQLFLKGAGKLFDSVSKNKEMLHKKYQDYIYNTNFMPVIDDNIMPFKQQLELFEESIVWDVEQFYSSPLTVLNEEMDKVQSDIERHQDSLNTMQERPEVYQNPLTLFELKLRQYELMNTIN